MRFLVLNWCTWAQWAYGLKNPETLKSIDYVSYSVTISYMLLSHPGLGWIYIFSSFPRTPPPQRPLPLTSKPFVLNLRYLGQRIYRYGGMYWSLHGLDSMSWLWHRFTKYACLHDKVRTTYPITPKRDSFIAPVMLITWLDVKEVLLETVYWWFVFSLNR